MIETAGDIVELFRLHAADSAVVVTGGFRLPGSQNVAEGLHVSRSVTMRPRADWKAKDSGTRFGGFLAQGVSTVEILPASILDAQLAAYAEIIQSKPVLLEAGRFAIVRDNFERANRVAVLIGKDGDIGVLGAFSSAISATYSLYELSILAGKLAEKAGLQVASAINLEPGWVGPSRTPSVPSSLSGAPQSPPQWRCSCRYGRTKFSGMNTTASATTVSKPSSSAIGRPQLGAARNSPLRRLASTARPICSSKVAMPTAFG